jgi:hypothetical protein
VFLQTLTKETKTYEASFRTLESALVHQLLPTSP